MMIARPWEKDNYPIQDALCSYNHSISEIPFVLPLYHPILTPFPSVRLDFTMILALPGHNFELMKPEYLKPQSSIWQLSKNLQQMRNSRIPNLGSHQTGDYPKAGDKRSHKLTECEKKKVSRLTGYFSSRDRAHFFVVRITLF